MKYSKKITSRCRNITKLEEEWIALCEKNGRDCWIQWEKIGPRKEKPWFWSCDLFDGCDGRKFETIDEAIEWERGYIL